MKKYMVLVLVLLMTLSNITKAQDSIKLKQVEKAIEETSIKLDSLQKEKVKLEQKLSGKQTSQSDFLFYIIISLLSVILGLLIWKIFFVSKPMITRTTQKSRKKMSNTPKEQFKGNIKLNSVMDEESQDLSEKDDKEIKLRIKEENKNTGTVKNSKNIENITLKSKYKTNSTKWFVVADSVIGQGHIEDNIPCQDNHKVEELGEGWGIAVVCDGAGSATNSHKGSEFVADRIVKIFQEIIENKKWQVEHKLPSEEEWQELTRVGFGQTYVALYQFAKDHNYELKSLACTVILTIYTPLGLLVAHIGDGRAGYQDAHGQWKASMEPFRGEENNETVFITSRLVWGKNNDALEAHKDGFMESRVIKEKVKAFTLMSDGCEKQTFEISVKIPDEATRKQFGLDKEKLYYDPNRPFASIFNGFVATLKEEVKTNTPKKDTDKKWENFLKAGNEKFKNERDDKTLILGILLD